MQRGPRFRCIHHRSRRRRAARREGCGVVARRGRRRNEVFARRAQRRDGSRRRRTPRRDHSAGRGARRAAPGRRRARGGLPRRDGQGDARERVHDRHVRPLLQQPRALRRGRVAPPDSRDARRGYGAASGRRGPSGVSALLRAAQPDLRHRLHRAHHASLRGRRLARRGHHLRLPGERVVRRRDRGARLRLRDDRHRRVLHGLSEHADVEHVCAPGRWRPRRHRDRGRLRRDVRVASERPPEQHPGELRPRPGDDVRRSCDLEPDQHQQGRRVLRLRVRQPVDGLSLDQRQLHLPADAELRHAEHDRRGDRRSRRPCGRASRTRPRARC